MSVFRFGCASARHRAVSVNGLRLHALEWGEEGRPPLCFLHGGSAHAHWFDLVASAFADRFHVVSLDQRGHGESDWATPPAYATENFAADLLGLMEALGWREMIVVGHSMGGHNALAFAAWHPGRVRALVVVDSRPAIPEERLHAMRRRGWRPLRRHASVEAAVEAFHLIPRETVADPALLGHLARNGLVEREDGWVYRFDPACNGSRRPADAWRLLAGIAAPTLVVRGEWSPILTREAAERLARTIPNGSLVEIPGVYHHLVLDAPDAFARALEAFLASGVG